MLDLFSFAEPCFKRTLVVVSLHLWGSVRQTFYLSFSYCKKFLFRIFLLSRPTNVQHTHTHTHTHIYIYIYKQYVTYNKHSHMFRWIFYTITLRNFVPRRSQFGRWPSSGKRSWFTESHIVLIISFLLVVLFTQCIVDKIKKLVLYEVKQLNNILLK